MKKRYLGVLLLGFLGLTGTAVAENSAPQQVKSVLGRCAVSESLPEAELRPTAEQVDSLMAELQQSQDRRKKVWLYRLQRCAEFLDYRIEATGEGGTGTE